jgi:hypothetical protein
MSSNTFLLAGAISLLFAGEAFCKDAFRNQHRLCTWHDLCFDRILLIWGRLLVKKLMGQVMVKNHDMGPSRKEAHWCG